jgi:hypothetical protein
MLAVQNNRAGGAARANLPELVDDGRARDKAAELVGVSSRSIASAAKVLRDSADELVTAVDRGKVRCRIYVHGMMLRRLALHALSSKIERLFVFSADVGQRRSSGQSTSL